MNNPAFRLWNRMFPYVSSVAAGSDGVLYASSLGQGVYRIGLNGDWKAMDEMWPEDVTVNRLICSGSEVTACTNSGLLTYMNDTCWKAAEVAVPAYRLRQGESGRLLAATEYGIWCNMGSGWFNWAYPDCIVYDILYLPGYVVIGCDRGIAYYDRLTGEWAEFALRTAVTSLAVFRGRLVGTCECGQLVYGNGRGGFNVCRFDGLFLVSVIQRGSDIFLCSDRGLFRLAEWQGRFMVLPVRLGFPVSDAAWIGDTMIVATLSRGIELVG